VSKNYLRRYTDIPALVSLLKERKITLLDPASWDDKNDSRFLELYQEKEKLETLLALCFTQADETYHHWRIFANGTAGVCIRFDRAALIKAVMAHDGVRMKTVTYLTMEEIRNQKLELRELPFLKRYPFTDENEFRLIYESSIEELDYLDIPIPLSAITRITLSPWLPRALSNNLKATLRSIDGCSKLDIARSTLIKNEEWHNRGKAATHGAAISTSKKVSKPARTRKTA
jgi:hypothetical protein